MDRTSTDNERLRSALFRTDAGAKSADRVLTRAEDPTPKRTPSELGHPNGRRTLLFNR